MAHPALAAFFGDQEAGRPLGLAPGLYRVLHDIDVTAGRTVGSGDVGEVLEGTALTVLEVAEVEEDRRIRGRLEEPCGWISLAALGSSHRWAVPVLCGLYCAVRGMDVTAAAPLDSEDMAAVEEGQLVEVVEVVHRREDRRVRARIDNPAGWISLLNTENAGQWAVHVEQEDAEVRDVLSREPSLFGSCTLPYSSLRRVLTRSHKKLSAAHKEATNAWRGPLSLFGPAAESQARERGVPDWAIACVHKMQQLVDVAAELHDLTDVYQAQINKAESSGRGLHRSSLRIQLDRLDELSRHLRAHVPALYVARAAFDSPEASPEEAPVVFDGSTELPRDCSRAGREVIIETPSRIREHVESASLGLWRTLRASLNAGLLPADDTQCEPEQLSPSSTQGRRLERVTVQAGSAVYSIGFEYSDGTARTSLSGWAGQEKETFVLEDGEFLVGVRGRQRLRLDAVGFVTSRGRESDLFGGREAGDEFSLRASPGFQIWSVERNFLGRIARLVEVPEPSR